MILYVLPLKKHTLQNCFKYRRMFTSDIYFINFMVPCKNNQISIIAVKNKDFDFIFKEIKYSARWHEGLDKSSKDLHRSQMHKWQISAGYKFALLNHKPTEKSNI